MVDDGSIDGSLDVCTRFADNSLVQVIAQTRQGASTARNAGTRVAKGSWFQFLDADDLLASDKIQLQMERAMIEGDQYLYSCTWRRFIDMPINWVPDQSALCVGELDSVEWMVRKYSNHCMMALHAWLVPRPVLERVQGWDESLSMNDDGEYFDRLVLAAKGVKFVVQANCFYRTGHTTSMSRTFTRAAVESAKRSVDLGIGRLLALENSRRTRVACANQLQLFAYQFCSTAPDLADQAAAAALHIGGAAVSIPGGLWLKRLAMVIGWRHARRLQAWYYKMRFGQV